MIRTATICIILLGISSVSFAQDEIPEVTLNELTPAASEDEQEAIFNNILDLFQEPLDLNNAEREDLQKLNLLSEQQIEGILRHRATTGHYESIYELQVIEELDLFTIKKILPFITVISSDNSWKGLLARIHKNPADFIIKYERSPENKKGYSSNASESTRYLGKPYKTYIRIKSSKAKDFSIGLIAEKDPGEIYKWEPAKNYYLFDFASFHLGVYNKGKLKSFTIGDYKLQAGQGLIFGSGYYLGKNAEAISGIKRAGSGILQNTSVTESGFFRGTAASLTFKRITVSGFYSSINKDASINTTESDSLSNEYFSTVYTTGYHRTISEINKKAAISQRDAGFIISFQNKIQNLNIGLNFINTHFSKSFEKNTNIYNSFDFKGQDNTCYSIDAAYRFYNLSMFSEAAFSTGGGKALVGGVLASLHKKIDFLFLLRKYDKNFYSFYGRAFGENTTNKNETGLYWGIKITPNKKYNLSAYFDTYTFPWLKYRTYEPSRGNDFNIRFSYQPSKTTLAYIQIRKAIQEQNSFATNITYATETCISEMRTLGLDYKANEFISLTTKIIQTKAKKNNLNTNGYFLIQDINVHFRGIKLSLRYALSDAENYDNRAYVFEKDVLLGYALPAYYGKGSRAYLVLHGRLLKHLGYWIKYGYYIYPFMDMTGTGSEETQGNIRSEIKIQLRYTLG
ncbi:MAG: helix-hairpin-helix domain-containing protein [Sporocytophaga sp.]|uniref:ComEA family DNA-binding protein n=1 Tax=Sporocytophaga sp. TaxID=2231183 RepID=UPI001B031D44|nr:helix-hairpin-helix domain-containing protein [Sporocytophaga sp.]MBO9701099.1 helix-hairpin-helix domain-containing protein [Sporocytophaga sp.]